MSKRYGSMKEVRATTEKNKKESSEKIKDQKKTLEDMKKAEQDFKKLKGGLANKENKDLESKLKQAMDKAAQQEQAKLQKTEKHLSKEKIHSKDLTQGEKQKESDVKTLSNIGAKLKEQMMKPYVNEAKSKSASEANELKKQGSDVKKDIDKTSREGKDIHSKAQRLKNFSTRLGR